MTRRKRLKQFLETEIDLMKESDASAEELVRTLSEAVLGLESLESGQVDEIFAPAKTGFHGLRPAVVKRCEAHAVGAVLALRNRGYTVADAEQEVADAFDIKPEALHKWSTKVKRTKVEGLLQILDRYKSTVKFPVEPSIERILAEIKRKGEIYRQVLARKTGKKTK